MLLGRGEVVVSRGQTRLAVTQFEHGAVRLQRIYRSGFSSGSRMSLLILSWECINLSQAAISALSIKVS